MVSQKNERFLQKLPKTVGDLSKIIVSKGFNKSPKVQKIAKSGLSGCQHGGLVSISKGKPWSSWVEGDIYRLKR